MTKIEKIYEAIKKRELWKKIQNRRKTRSFYKWVNKYFDDDLKYLFELFKFHLGKEPNIDNPRTYNEKLLWLKLHWRDERVYALTDKYEVRKHIEELGLGDILIPLFLVADRYEDINFDSMPSEFIIKTTHDSGGTFIVSDKNSKKQMKAAKKKINSSMNNGKYNRFKEWVYEKTKPRIIIEKLMKEPDSNYNSLTDYKFFCFNGKAKFLFAGTDRNTDVKFDFFDLDWNWLDVRQGHENNINRPKKPDNFLQMIKIAETLSGDFPQVRVDLYNINGKIYFGEITFFHFSGLVPFDPPSFDDDFGEFIDIKDVENGRQYFYSNNHDKEYTP